MTSSPNRLTLTLAIGFFLASLSLAVVYLLVSARKELRPAPEMPVLSWIADFQMTNELGGEVTLGTLSNRVWVADIFFTRCAGPCLRMSRQMKELQDALPRSSRARLVSISTDPLYDTPPVLARYAQRFDADTNRWIFLTGSEASARGLITGSLKLSSIKNETGEKIEPSDLYIHDTRLAVVDKSGRLRGVFDTGGEGVNWADSKSAVLRAVARLEREP